jgi:hypothetical protein
VVGESSQGASGVLYTVAVSTLGGSYPIQIGYGTLAGAGAEIARRTKATMAAVVTVPPVGRRYAGPLLRSLRESGLRPRRIEVPDGDASKNLRQVARLYDALLDAGWVTSPASRPRPICAGSSSSRCPRRSWRWSTRALAARWV